MANLESSGRLCREAKSGPGHKIIFAIDHSAPPTINGNVNVQHDAVTGASGQVQ
jgi:hypothetical protein